MLPIVYIVDVEVRSFAIFKSWEDFASPQPMGILPTVFVSWNQFRRRESTCRENACQSSRVKRTYICKFILTMTCATFMKILMKLQGHTYNVNIQMSRVLYVFDSCFIWINRMKFTYLLCNQNIIPQNV